VSAPAAADALAVLLTPYTDPHLAETGRVVDVPVDVAARALALLADDVVTSRPNLVQPPMRELVSLAADLGGRLVGAVVPGRAFVRLDGVQVDAAIARTLAERIAAAWPADGGVGDALSAATAEAWTSWDADWPVWTGSGADLLRGAAPSEAAVVGLVWD
jgi:hypothetical protein